MTRLQSCQWQKICESLSFATPPRISHRPYLCLPLTSLRFICGCMWLWVRIPVHRYRWYDDNLYGPAYIWVHSYMDRSLNAHICVCMPFCARTPNIPIWHIFEFDLLGVWRQTHFFECFRTCALGTWNSGQKVTTRSHHHHYGLTITIILVSCHGKHHLPPSHGNSSPKPWTMTMIVFVASADMSSPSHQRHEARAGYRPQQPLQKSVAAPNLFLQQVEVRAQHKPVLEHSPNDPSHKTRPR